MTNLLTENDRETLSKEIAPVVEDVNALVIKSPEQSIQAQELLKLIKTKQKKIIGFFKEMKDAAFKSWRVITDEEAAHLAPLEEAEKTLKFKVTTFVREEERKVQEAARIAEAARQEAERKRQEELTRQAEEARKKGKIEKAEALAEKAAAHVAQPIFTPPPAPVRAEGSTFKKIWKAEVVNMADLLMGIYNGKIHGEILKVDQSAINKLASAYKNSTALPGLRFYETTEMSVRA